MQIETSCPAWPWLVAIGLLSPLVLGAQYYVATDGSDGNVGSADLPWRTIGKAAFAMLPGDSVIVRAGNYNERVATVRGGTQEKRITFQAHGQAAMRGWIINHAHITVRGFNISGHSASSESDGHVSVGRDAKFFELLECIVRGDRQFIRSDMMFNAGSSSISTETGGLVSTGISTGDTIFIGAGAAGVSIDPANRGRHTVTGISPTAISVATALVEQGPLQIYVSGSFQYGMHFHAASESALILGNTFSNLGFDTWFVNGSKHRFASNIVEHANGWDIMHFSGADHVFERNWFRNSPLVVYQVSPDLFENWATKYERIVFKNNFIENMTGVMAAQKVNTTVSGPLLFTENVFVDVSAFLGRFPHTTFEGNTFLRVAAQNSPVVQVFRHALSFNIADYATNAVIRDNIFVGCGQPQRPWTEETVGWYEFSGPMDRVTAEGNFVASGPPGYGAKLGWPEDPTLNGGDPGFVDIHDPLGPDGIPFTADDGLRLLPSSKLVLAGAEGRTVGAYLLPGGGPPVLAVQRIGQDLLELQWPETVESWTLESAATIMGLWMQSSRAPVLHNGRFRLTVETSNSAAFFRLVR